MKKLRRPLKKSKPSTKPTRITNETIAEHRERVLSEGKRFKYPVQYTKNKLVVNAIGVGLLAVIVFVIFCWWQLYKVQSTADFFYRLTRVIPVPVASVAGQQVRYGDYLLNYRMSEVYLNTVASQDTTHPEQDITTYNYYKVQAMNNAVADAYASKLAKQHNVQVTDGDVDQAIAGARKMASAQGTVSENVFNRSVSRLYGTSPTEFRYFLKKRLLREKVSYLIDDDAKQASDAVQAALDKSPEASFDKLVASLNKTLPVKAQVFVSGWVSKDNKDGGLAAAAAKLDKGEVTGPIKPDKGDGYYFIKLRNTNQDDEIDYQFIKVPLTEFHKQLEALYNQHKVDYYVSLPDVKTEGEMY